MSESTDTIESIEPIVLPRGSASGYQIRVENPCEGVILIHVSPAVLCGHCGCMSTIFIPTGSLSMCARCNNAREHVKLANPMPETLVDRVVAFLEDWPKQQAPVVPEEVREEVTTCA